MAHHSVTITVQRVVILVSQGVEIPNEYPLVSKLAWLDDNRLHPSRARPACSRLPPPAICDRLDPFLVVRVNNLTSVGIADAYARGSIEQIPPLANNPSQVPTARLNRVTAALVTSFKFLVTEVVFQSNCTSKPIVCSPCYLICLTFL